MMMPVEAEAGTAEEAETGTWQVETGKTQLTRWPVGRSERARARARARCVRHIQSSWKWLRPLVVVLGADLPAPVMLADEGGAFRELADRW